MTENKKSSIRELQHKIEDILLNWDDPNFLLQWDINTISDLAASVLCVELLDVEEILMKEVASYW